MLMLARSRVGAQDIDTGACQVSHLVDVELYWESD